jgi:hypothetical protein
VCRLFTWRLGCYTLSGRHDFDETLYRCTITKFCSFAPQVVKGNDDMTVERTIPIATRATGISGTTMKTAPTAAICKRGTESIGTLPGPVAESDRSTGGGAIVT